MQILPTCPLSDFKPVRGEGCWLWDRDERRYLDLYAGTGCAVLGHGHPQFTSIIEGQLRRLVHTAPGVVADEVLEAASLLGELMPRPLDHVTFLNTGSEAVEFAIKLARIATGRNEVVGFRKGYYGATCQALALSEAGRGAAYLPSLGQVPPLPAPRCDRCPLGETHPACHLRCLRDWEAAVGDAAGRQLAALLVEPVMAAAGVVVPPPRFLEALAAMAAKWGCLLIAEEVSTGVGRTGGWFGFQREELRPDIVVLGKALGNGLPVAAVVVTSELAKSCAGRLVHVRSHQNDPLSGAAAAAVLSIIRQEGLVHRVRQTGEYLLQQLRGLQREYDEILHVRGSGSMVGVDLRGADAAARGLLLQRRLFRLGVIVDFKPAVATFRFFPPYVIGRSQIDLAMQALDSALLGAHQGRRIAVLRRLRTSATHARAA